MKKKPTDKEKDKRFLQVYKSNSFIYIPSLEKNILELLENTKLPNSFEKQLRKLLKESKKMVILIEGHDGEEMIRYFSIKQFEKGYNEIYGKQGNFLKVRITRFD